jgi:hypothetical protein
MTVQEFLENNESSIGASGAAWDSCDALKQLNRARSVLYGLDTWHGLSGIICVRACGKLSFPYFVGDIKAAYRCKGNIYIAPGEYWVNGTESCCGTQEGITDDGIYAPVPVANSFSSRLGVRPADIGDSGKIVKISYITDGGSHITDELTLDYEKFAVTENQVRRVISIAKTPTYGPVMFASISPDGDCCEKLFKAYPPETHLKYRQYCISSQCCSSCQYVSIRYKKKFFRFTEMHYNHDLDIDEHAMLHAMMAISELDKRNIEGYRLYQEHIKSAINYLKKSSSKSEETVSDLGVSNDYPSIV